jgi:ATP-dependent helicase/nuclease subunit A
VDSDDAEPSVSVAPFVSETDAHERVREQHESRRLLYVAMTRARDRLYLSSAIKEGVLTPGRGSLAEVLPASLKPLFGEAAKTSEQTLVWRSGSGRAFEWRVCKPVPRAPRVQTLFGDSNEPAQSFGRMSRESVRPRISVSDWFAGGLQRYASDDGPGDRLVGILVHRLLQATGSGLLVERDAESIVTSLATLEERALTPDLDRVLETAVRIHRRLIRVPLVSEVLASGVLHAEVPFSLHTDGPDGPVVLRGVIDGLAVMPDNRVIVLEFKTGARRAAHERQLALYLRAAGELFPGRTVEGRLIYDE